MTATSVTPVEATEATDSTSAVTAVTYVVPSENLETLRAKVAKLAKRAVKLGFAPDAVRIVSETRDHDEPIKRVNAEGDVEIIGVRRWIAVVLEAPMIKLAGWKFVASVAHTSDGNILSAVPNTTVPVRFREAASECEHCRTARNRLETFIVVNDDGRDAQVGRNCLVDFIGHDAHKAATLAQYLAEFDASARDHDGEEFSGGRSEYAFPLASFLTRTAQVIRRKGWTSRKTAREFPGLYATADTVLDALIGKGTSADALRRDLGAIEEGDKAAAEAALAWVESELEPKAVANSANDYEWNTVVVARSGLTTIKTAGLAASIIVAYQRALSIFQERVRKAKQFAASAFQGEVGKRLKGLDVTIEGMIPIESDWGSSDLVKFYDAAGNVFVWFNSGTPIEKAKIGTVVRIDGTVKQHKAYNGINQTTLTRVTVWTAEGIAEADAKAAKRAARAAKSVAAAPERNEYALAAVA